jgi:hypothetical protein
VTSPDSPRPPAVPAHACRSRLLLIGSSDRLKSDRSRCIFHRSYREPRRESCWRTMRCPLSTPRAATNGYLSHRLGRTPLCPLARKCPNGRHRTRSPPTCDPSIGQLRHRILSCPVACRAGRRPARRRRPQARHQQPAVSNEQLARQGLVSKVRLSRRRLAEMTRKTLSLPFRFVDPVATPNRNDAVGSHRLRHAQSLRRV